MTSVTLLLPKLQFAQDIPDFLEQVCHSCLQLLHRILGIRLLRYWDARSDTCAIVLGRSSLA